MFLCEIRHAKEALVGWRGKRVAFFQAKSICLCVTCQGVHAWSEAALTCRKFHHEKEVVWRFEEVQKAHHMFVLNLPNSKANHAK
jgi:hypothetical protein